MKAGRLRPFHVKHLSELPDACPACPLGGAPEVDGQAPGWLRAAEEEWGRAGVMAWDGDRPVAYLLLAPPLHVPRTGPQGGVALSPDAAVVMAVRVLEGHTGHGIGRQLVQEAAAIVARGPAPFRALEAEATRTHPSCGLPPAGFLEAVGFQVCREGAARVRVRLDLDRTARWRPHLGRAMGRIASWGARPLPAEPAGRAGAAAARSEGLVAGDGTP